MEEGKLIKRGETDYRLYVNEIPFATTDNSPYKKLSLKNCESIENGYDLDELAVLSTKEETTIVGNQKMAQGFIKGFQKALEILGDKKFSLDDMKEAYGRGFLHQGIKSFNSHIQSLQQTEWQVKFDPNKKDDYGCLKLIKC